MTHSDDRDPFEVDPQDRLTPALEEDDGLFKKMIPVGLGLVLVALVGGGVVVFLNERRTPTQTPPLVLAPQGPEKVKPDDPGGLRVDHQDKLILNEVPAGQVVDESVERLLPPPETPLPLQPRAPSLDARADAPSSAPAGEEAAQMPSVHKNAQDESNPERQDNKAQEQGELESVLQPPSVVTAPSAPAPVTLDEAQVPVTTAEQVQPKKDPSQKESVQKKSDRKTEQAKKQTTAPAKEPPAPSKSAKTDPVVQPSSGQYVVQLASLRRESAVQAEWGKLQKKLPKLLGSATMLMEKADISGAGVRYRLQTGPFPTKAAADRLCQKLKVSGRDCLVKKVK